MGIGTFRFCKRGFAIAENKGIIFHRLIRGNAAVHCDDIFVFRKLNSVPEVVFVYFGTVRKSSFRVFNKVFICGRKIIIYGLFKGIIIAVNVLFAPIDAGKFFCCVVIGKRKRSAGIYKRFVVGVSHISKSFAFDIKKHGHDGVFVCNHHQQKSVFINDFKFVVGMVFIIKTKGFFCGNVIFPDSAFGIIIVFIRVSKIVNGIVCAGISCGNNVVFFGKNAYFGKFFSIYIIAKHNFFFFFRIFGTVSYVTD